MKIAAISGSLRKGSFNTALLRAASELAPAGIQIEICSIDGLPHYNEDVQAEGWPVEVEALAAKIREADALLIATPEYNYSVPGVLKNAIDWLSRLDDQPFGGKAIGLLGASKGALGTVRSQGHLRLIFVFLNGIVMNRPEVFVGSAHQKFDDQGRLTDQATRDFLETYLATFRKWTEERT